MQEVYWGVSTLGLNTAGRVKKEDEDKGGQLPVKACAGPRRCSGAGMTTQTCPAPGKGAWSLYSFTEQSLDAAFLPAPREKCDLVGSALAAAIPKEEPS